MVRNFRMFYVAWFGIIVGPQSSSSTWRGTGCSGSTA